MDYRRMTEPALPGRRQAASRRWGVMTRRLVPAAVAATAAVLVGVLPAAGAPQVGSAPTVAAPAAVPGTDPAVQKWFKAREGLQIELNNALLPAMRLPRPASAARPVCTRLLRAAGVLAALLPGAFHTAAGPGSGGPGHVRAGRHHVPGRRPPQGRAARRPGSRGPHGRERAD